jgi:hypothetical protein
MIRNSSMYSDAQQDIDSNFTAFQLHRFAYVPKVPAPLAKVTESNVVLHEEEYPIDDGVKAMFPTLLTHGMRYFELREQDDVIVSH